MSNGLQITCDLIVWWPVEVCQPADGGEVKIAKIELKLKVPRTGKLRKLLDKENPVTLSGEDKFVVEHVMDWKGVADGEGQPLKFSKDNLIVLLDHPGGRIAVVSALFSAGSCLPVTAKKTLSPSPAGGLAAKNRKMN